MTLSTTSGCATVAITLNRNTNCISNESFLKEQVELGKLNKSLQLLLLMILNFRCENLGRPESESFCNMGACPINQWLVGSWDVVRIFYCVFPSRSGVHRVWARVCENLRE